MKKSGYFLSMSAGLLLLAFLYTMSLARVQNANEHDDASAERINSPDGKYLIEKKWSTTQAYDSEGFVNPPGKIYLRQKGSSLAVMIRSFNRDADVLWSPDSKSFAINDWQSSDRAEAYLYSLSDSSKPIAVNQKLASASLPAQDKRIVFSDDHQYIVVKNWASPTDLTVKAFGHYTVEPQPDVTYAMTYLWNIPSNRLKLLERQQ